jgi:hypothetical protein
MVGEGDCGGTDDDEDMNEDFIMALEFGSNPPPVDYLCKASHAADSFNHALQRRLTQALLGIAVALAFIFPGSAQITIPKLSPNDQSILPEGIRQEWHLAVSLFSVTNQSFDTAVFKSVRSIVKPPFVTTFEQISFVFSYPTNNEFVVSHCEMGLPVSLLCSGESVTRTNMSRTNEIPLNYVRIVDPHKKTLTAELDLLIRLESVGRPEDVQFVRRSFQFANRDGWKLE